MKTKSLTQHERFLQKAAHILLSDPSVVRQTFSGKRLQILSPGRINSFAGPDFLEMAVLMNGTIIVGNAEFHRKSEEWYQHGHHENEEYESVILHIVIEHNAGPKHDKEILVIPEEDISTILATQDRSRKLKVDITSLEDLQHYSLLRLLRKTAEAKKMLNRMTLEKAHYKLSQAFIERYFSRRRRPVYTEEKLISILNQIEKSQSANFLYSIKKSDDISIPDYLQTIIREKNTLEGSHLRRELVLNCVLPIALCLADEESRIALFLWYWSTPALNQYGILKRRFRQLPQNFLWQQQGMLEYIKLYGSKQNVCSEALKDYGFAETLDFYKLASAPLRGFGSDE